MKLQDPCVNVTQSSVNGQMGEGNSWGHGQTGVNGALDGTQVGVNEAEIGVNRVMNGVVVRMSGQPHTSVNKVNARVNRNEKQQSVNPAGNYVNGKEICVNVTNGSVNSAQDSVNGDRREGSSDGVSECTVKRSRDAEQKTDGDSEESNPKVPRVRAKQSMTKA